MNKKRNGIRRIFSDKKHTEAPSYSKKKSGIIRAAVLSVPPGTKPERIMC